MASKDRPTNSEIASKLEGRVPGAGTAYADGVARARAREQELLRREAAEKARRAKKQQERVTVIPPAVRREVTDAEIVAGKHRRGAKDD